MEGHLAVPGLDADDLSSTLVHSPQTQPGDHLLNLLEAELDDIVTTDNNVRSESIGVINATNNTKYMTANIPRKSYGAAKTIVITIAIAFCTAVGLYLSLYFIGSFAHIADSRDNRPPDQTKLTEFQELCLKIVKLSPDFASGRESGVSHIEALATIQSAGGPTILRDMSSWMIDEIYTTYRYVQPDKILLNMEQSCLSQY